MPGMCCFSKTVAHVGATRIFARRVDDRRQALVYSMNLSFDTELAMVLPLPVERGSGDDAVRFVDLSGYPEFFDDLGAAFPPLSFAAFGQSRHVAPLEDLTLVVHEVGDFEASFVPSRAEFARLDERFRLDPKVWDRLPAYDDYGFAVFGLAPNRTKSGSASPQTIHPMAFVFPSREPSSLFFPTVHVHDGSVPSAAMFDHTLYAQDDAVIGATLGWSRSNGPLSAYIDVERAAGITDGSRGGFAQPLVGSLPNEDTWLVPPPGVELATLRGRGECFSFAVSATHAYHSGPAHDARAAAWRANARRIGGFARRFGDALRALEHGERTRLALAPLDASLRPHFINGTQLWTGTSYMDGRRGHDGGSGYVTFRPFNDRIEPQEVVLGFAVLPDEATTDRIHGLLRGVLDRCLDAA